MAGESKRHNLVGNLYVALRTCLIVDADARRVEVHERFGEGWRSSLLEGAVGVPLICLGASCGLAELFDGV